MPDVKSSESCDSRFCVELAVDLPDSKRGRSRFIENPKAIVVGQMKQKAVEVSERHLTDSAEAFRQAKGKEVRSYIQSQCFKVLSPEQQQKGWQCSRHEMGTHMEIVSK